MRNVKPVSHSAWFSCQSRVMNARRVKKGEVTARGPVPKSGTFSSVTSEQEWVMDHLFQAFENPTGNTSVRALGPRSKEIQSKSVNSARLQHILTRFGGNRPWVWGMAKGVFLQGQYEGLPLSFRYGSAVPFLGQCSQLQFADGEGTTALGKIDLRCQQCSRLQSFGRENRFGFWV